MKKPSPIRMSYDTYIFLKELLEKEEQKLWDSYLSALHFIKDEPSKSSFNRARQVYEKEKAVLRARIKELRAAAGATYKNHPDKEMRKFWNV